jgi:hypothetical protein
MYVIHTSTCIVDLVYQHGFRAYILRHGQDQILQFLEVHCAVSSDCKYDQHVDIS